jgi:hypothetical protein
MPRWVRSLVPPLFGGVLGGAITFVVLSIATITYLGVPINSKHSLLAY